MDDLEQPTLPADDAELERLRRRYEPADPTRDTGASPEHVAEAWRDTLDDALDDALEPGLEAEARR